MQVRAHEHFVPHLRQPEIDNLWRRQNVHRLNEWLKSLAVDPRAPGTMRLMVNGALSDFVYSPDGSANDPLQMPAHSFALDCCLWLILTHHQTFPELNIQEFMHGATIWAGLLRVVADRVTFAGVNSSFVTPDFVAANLERLLQTIQADLDLGTDVDGRGLIPLVSQPLHSVPAMSRFGVQVLTTLGAAAGDPDSSMILIRDDVSNTDFVAQAMREGYFFFPTPR